MGNQILIEKHQMSAGKSVVWRIAGILILALITYIYTRSLFQTTVITILHHSIFLIVFYVHERVWLLSSMKYSLRRSIFKMFTYETILGNLILGTITYIITGNVKDMTNITVTYIIIKHITYVYHEFIWKNVSWGSRIINTQ